MDRRLEGPRVPLGGRLGGPLGDHWGGPLGPSPAQCPPPSAYPHRPMPVIKPGPSTHRHPNSTPREAGKLCRKPELGPSSCFSINWRKYHHGLVFSRTPPPQIEVWWKLLRNTTINFTWSTAGSPQMSISGQPERLWEENGPLNGLDPVF